MPKVNADALEKKFTCKYCGETIRSRQGLSGHIQFKHSDKHVVKSADSDFLLSKMTEFKAWKLKTDYHSINQAAARLIGGWYHANSLCKIYNIELTKQDFKNYILTGLAQACISCSGLEPATP